MIRALLTDHQRTLQAAGIFIALGLIAEAITLYFAHPFAFMGFIFFGGAMIGIGIALYVWSLVKSFAEPGTSPR